MLEKIFANNGKFKNTMLQKYFAHSLENKPTEEWQQLEEHLKNVANLSREFAEPFGNGDWAELAGLWHDLGKFLPEWQAYIRKEKSSHPNHSTAGAVLALERFKSVGRILAYLVAGHHAGLPDWLHDEAGGDLENRAYDTHIGKLNTAELDIIKKIPDAISYINLPAPKTPPLQINTRENMLERQEHFHLWIRMLFSCLKDADCLDTEKFTHPENAGRREKYPALEELSNRFDAFMIDKQMASKPSQINLSRNNILKQCREKAILPSGFFSLTVPTGGGKTLSAMAFALKHALSCKPNKQRIIMAIPYTSIIEQTAKVYKYGSDDDEEIRKAIQLGKTLFGEDAVLEHHSNIDPERENEKSRLASENWDAPIIVTTNVQLFESLLASRTSSCRKLHNIANSIIILDEAQMLPPEYLKSILSVLRGIVKHFGVTVLFCTATQPALCGKIGSGQAEFTGIENVTEIIDKPDDLVNAFKRVEVNPPNLKMRTEWPDLAKELGQYEQVLCIVNTRKDCRDLHALMPKGTIHLSANMCGEERTEVIGAIKQKLKSGASIRVISTQLVEAGIDIDFPVVYRALAGIDSIAQAAGRCNREAKLNAQGKFGKVVVFQPTKPAPQGLLRKGEDTTRAVLGNTPVIDFQSTIYANYFKSYYASLNNFDKPKFQERLVQEAGEFKFQFRTFAQNVRLIDDTIQQGIIVRYQGKGANSNKFIELLRKNGPEQWLMRKLQRFIVNVPLSILYKLRDESHIEEIHGYWVQLSTGLYRPGYGLMSDFRQWDEDLNIV